MFCVLTKWNNLIILIQKYYCFGFSVDFIFDIFPFCMYKHFFTFTNCVCQCYKEFVFGCCLWVGKLSCLWMNVTRSVYVAGYLCHQCQNQWRYGSWIHLCFLELHQRIAERVLELTLLTQSKTSCCFLKSTRQNVESCKLKIE